MAWEELEKAREATDGRRGRLRRWERSSSERDRSENRGCLADRQGSKPRGGKAGVQTRTTRFLRSLPLSPSFSSLHKSTALLRLAPPLAALDHSGSPSPTRSRLLAFFLSGDPLPKTLAFRSLPLSHHSPLHYSRSLWLLKAPSRWRSSCSFRSLPIHLPLPFLAHAPPLALPRSAFAAFGGFLYGYGSSPFPVLCARVWSKKRRFRRRRRFLFDRPLTAFSAYRHRLHLGSQGDALLGQQVRNSRRRDG